MWYVDLKVVDTQNMTVLSVLHCLAGLVLSARVYFLVHSMVYNDVRATCTPYSNEFT